MNGINQILNQTKEFEEILKAIKENKFPFNISGTAESQKAHLISSVVTTSSRGALVITYSDLQAQKLCEDLNFFMDEECVYIPPQEVILYKVESQSNTSKHKRINALNLLGERRIGVLSIESFLHFVMPKDKFTSLITSFEVGKTLDLTNLTETLVNMGYSRCDTIEGEGQFAVRGGIIDIFSPSSQMQIRMELFDDEIDSIRTFDIETQLSVDKINNFEIIPITEVEENGSILSYIPEDWLIFMDEPQRISESAKAYEWEHQENIKTLLEKEIIITPKEKYMNTYDEMLIQVLKRQVIGIAALSSICPDYKPKKTYPISVKILQSYGGKIEFLYDDINVWKEKNYRVIILGGSSTRAKRLAQALCDNSIEAQYYQNISELPPRGSIAITNGSLYKGFEYPLINTVIVSDKEIFAAEKKKRRVKSDLNTSKIKSTVDLEVGDYVVHNIHGIGRCMGIVRLEVNKIKKDYIKIEYRGEDFLYLPVSQLDLINKYVGGENKSMRLNKLGGVEWSNTKRKVKKSVADMAEQLVKLYAQRERLEGHAFSEDNTWQRQFEDSFLYEETEDQLRCIDEMKEDMQKKRPMDRLLCGDVGFGKTEVAMRGAFKAVLDGYQVAYLVPTTILASQHYNNFIQRMKDFPVNIRMLSRFCTLKEIKETTKMLKSGECDIVIGTHKLLQPNIEFKNLGMLIIDEEQRFGVAHKEKIKEMRKNIDVLTLSATPIPRTLHMAMVGIRDMSVIANPPEDRYPVQTYVVEYNKTIIQSAIERELSRNGQVYYLSNRVQGINKVAEELKELVPNARIGVAHGKMSETELEYTMMQMLNGEIDVLVCTTIIETGLDIPNVNTIIIENSDTLGLSQLYQLRGRVGRSNRLAYAYFTFKKDKSLDEVAEKRLRAIKEFTEFGSGFKIALRDLEIRGAGNVLGPEQHGFMASVGYDMYCSLLNEAVNEAMGKDPQANKENTTVDINVSAYIPEEYIPTSNLRIEAYKKIAAIEDLQDSYRVEEEFEDRYGDLPEEVRRLIEVSLLRLAASELGISEINQTADGIVFRLSSSSPIGIEQVSNLALKNKGKILYGAGDKPYILLRDKNTNEKKILENINIMLKDLKNG